MATEEEFDTLEEASVVKQLLMHVKQHGMLTWHLSARILPELQQCLKAWPEHQLMSSQDHRA